MDSSAIARRVRSLVLCPLSSGPINYLRPGERPMIILGINAHHADASAAILIDGKLVAAAEEERFRRIKHWAGFPSIAIEYCLREAGVGINDIDHIAVNRNPNAHMLQRVKFLIARRPSLSAVKRRLANRAQIQDLRGEIVEAFKIDSL